jgi:NitT/TauT family transport system substrate-binding protein
MIKKRNILLTILVIGLILFSAMFFTKTGFFTLKENNSLEIKVGYLPVLINLPLFVGIEEGIFQDYNLNVNAIEAESPNHIVSAIMSGHLDGAGGLAFPILFSAEERYPNEIKIFSTADETQDNFVSGIVVKPNSEINTINDLKGKRIGVYTGLVQVLFLKGIITGMGMNPEKDIEIIQIAPNLQLQGLESGQYDVLSTVEPFITIVKSKNLGKVIIENPRVKYIQDPFPSVATPISSKFLFQNPESAKAFILAYQDAIDFITENPDKAKKHLVKYTPITEDIVDNVNLIRFNKFGEEDRDNIQKNADWMFENGLLDSRIDVYSMFGSLSFID